MHYAHSTPRPDRSDWQTLPDHNMGVAALCGCFADRFGAGGAGRLGGLLHDLGKYSPEFQLYIQGKGPSVDHSTAGAREVIGLGSTPYDRLVTELLAYAIAGHHAGLPDRRGIGGSLDERLSRTVPDISQTWRDELTTEAGNLWPQLKLVAGEKGRAAFQLSVLGRMLFSCLVDADFLDTEAFCKGADGITVDRVWPRLADRLEGLIAAFDAHMAARREAMTPADRQSTLNVLRQEVLDHVRAQAARPRGVFTLDVPTGGGKTLASLAFALEHARRWQMERIIVAIPFSSITEQTADVFRSVLGGDMVLEHHSAIEPADGEGPRADAQAKLRRAMENWDAPVVVTTSVQLFDSLFSHRPSRCRKLHNIAGSVIILDEAQVLPLGVLKPCVGMLDELARNYGCTIVLCTATQPALIAPSFKGGFAAETTHELAPDPARLDAAFRRVTLEVRQAKLCDADLVAELAETSQGLVIVNSRRHALELHGAAQAAGLDGLVHLSTRQTAADRRAILAAVRARLAAGEPCRVVATSLIEAGVDVSFPRAWRAMAGLDNVIQAAGRVNREWRWPKEDSRIIVFEPDAAQPPAEILRFAQAMGRVAATHTDLFSKPAIEAYFQEVYWQVGEKELDSTPMPDMDGRMVRGPILAKFLAANGRTDFAYRTVGENFRLIRDTMVPVIIAVDAEAREALAALERGMPPAVAARALQSYVVQIGDKVRRQLLAAGDVAYMPGFADQFAVLKRDSLYSRETGLVWERAGELDEYIV